MKRSPLDFDKALTQQGEPPGLPACPANGRKQADLPQLASGPQLTTTCHSVGREKGTRVDNVILSAQ